MNYKKKMIVLISFAVVLIFGTVCSPFGSSFTFADEQKENHSGGFTIITEKVDGQMDLLAALQGKIKIQEGTISGLSIYKKLETGSGREPLIIKIKSQGPIPVSNLYAETKGNGLPEIGGLCAPSKLGWLCLSNVKMVVTEQTVQNITLPNATVETCYESQCGPIPEVNSISVEALEELLEEESEEKEDPLNEIKEELENAENQLENLNSLLEQLRSELAHLTSEDGLQQSIENTIAKVNNVLNANHFDDALQNDLIALTDKLSQQYDAFDQASNHLTTITKEIEEGIKQLEQHISDLEAKIQAIEKELQNSNEEAAMSQLEIYSELIEMAEKDKNGEKGEELEDPPEKSKELKDIKKGLNQVDENLSIRKEAFEELSSEVSPIKEQRNSFKEEIEKLKASIIELLNRIQEENKEEDNKEEEPDSDTDSEPDSGGNGEDEDAGTDTGEENDDKADPGTGNDDGNNDDGDDESSDEEEDDGSILTDLLDWLFHF
ncbi:hypothetical protein [Salirhabdus sp. Marseille-P4669]|uniref:hypothetical protein n=1 Tax=Salirhabdus sp. Marseille-P4669 TaxID=2042310 RepID=UPI000C7B5A2F|nr:hypothetical protein [Salirhabdus sp. Marseille-P4669]